MRANHIFKRLLANGLSCFAFFILTGFTPRQGQIVRLESSRNARTAADFRSSSDDIDFLAAKGLTGKITRVHQFKSTGNFGIQLTVTRGTDTNGRSQVGKSVWIYYQAAKSASEVDPGRRYMTIKDSVGNVVNGQRVVTGGRQIQTKVDRVPTTTKPRELVQKPLVQKPHREFSDSSLEGHYCATCTMGNGSADSTSQTALEIASNLEASTSLSQRIQTYSRSPQVSKMISYALSHQDYSRKGRHTCYRAVAKALFNGSGLISSYPGGAAAIDAPAMLKREGFVNLLETPGYREKFLRSPNAIPKGAVVVSNWIGRLKGGKKNYGHISIKTSDVGQPGFVSYDYTSEPKVPLTESSVVGIYIKKI